ncbi:MAG: CehA/McbA family metallohydrolase, partial [Phenylobacterium sp.]
MIQRQTDGRGLRPRARALLLGLLCLLGSQVGAHAAPSPTPAAASPREIELSGVITRENHETYVEAPFAVPEDTERLTVTFEYDRENRTVIDLGIRDPNGFRGWSGGNRSTFTLATSDATSAYIPGRIPPGEWRLILGVPNIRKGVEARWRATVRFDPAGAASPRSAFQDGPVRTGPGWYRGDLHTHSGHSDGSCASLSGRRVPCPVFRTLEAARTAGLDFIALTEHNSTSVYPELRALQAYYDTLLVLPGREVTTFQGHANVFGVTSPLPFQLGSPRAPTLDAVLDAVASEGGIVSINHPGMPSGELCMGCGWVAPLPDCSRITAVEIANGGGLRTMGSAEGPLSGLPFWEALLDRGCRVTGIAGSDNHDPDAKDGGQSPVGRPATVVYAPELSQPAILEGLRRGRVFVDIGAPAGASVDLTVSSGKAKAGMGGSLQLRGG